MHFPARAASILFLSIFGHKIGVVKSPALFQGKELQVTRFKVTCFCSHLIDKFWVRSIDRKQYSGIGIHGIKVRNPSFLRRFTLKLSNTCYFKQYLLTFLLQNARHSTVLNNHSTYSYSGIGKIERTLNIAVKLQIANCVFPKHGRNLFQLISRLLPTDIK